MVATMRLELAEMLKARRRTKVVQFWLCQDCLGRMSWFLRQRAGREQLVAKALSPIQVNDDQRCE